MYKNNFILKIILILAAVGFLFISSCSGKDAIILKQKETEINFDQSRDIQKESGELEERPESHPPDQLDLLPSQDGEITVEETNSTYNSINDKPEGWFTANQKADILLSGVDFNSTGGPLLFNHQGGIASDGEHLILADRNNNRVLIWNFLPEGNVDPDIVLGQENFTSNNPGEELDQLNWPVSVATDGTHLLVADTYNFRILIWNEFPTENGQSADLYIQGPKDRFKEGTVGWPWAVWTDGKKVIVTSTVSSQVLIWNSFPEINNQKPDIVLDLDDFGTPRTIGSDGTNLVIGDHNAFRSEPGNFFWKTFPNKNNQKYDFFMKNTPGGDMQRGEVMWGPTFTPDGKFVVISDKLHIWDSFPENENDSPYFSAGKDYASQSGDGSSIAYADGKLYISLCNGNKIVGFNSIPEEAEQLPDFVIGASDIHTNTLETEFIMSNPVPVTDGNSLFVSSDFDRKLYVWKSIPDESGAKPDYVYNLPHGPWDNTLYEGILVLAGKETVYIWNEPPVNGEQPDKIFSRNIGSITFGEIIGVALDKKYFYLSDKQNNKIFVWKGIPNDNSEPSIIIDIERPGRLSSDGQYLAVAATEGGPGGSVVLYKISDIVEGKPETILNGMFNLPQGVLVYDGHLFVGDTGFNAVHIWTDINEATSGKEADIFLGEKGITPKIGTSTFFWPATIAFDGSYLWVGEFKFSERLLRFSVR